MQKRWRVLADSAALLVVAALMAAGGLAACSSETTPSASPSPTPSSAIAFDPFPPGTATAEEAMAIGRDYAAQLTAKTLGTSALFAADAIVRISFTGEEFTGADVLAYYSHPGFLANDFSTAPMYATGGAAVVEHTVSNADGPLIYTLEMLSVSDGKITHQEVYGAGVAGGVAPQPMASQPGPADTGEAAHAVVTAYFKALAKGDVTAASALYDPAVVFQDADAKPGGAPELVAWHQKLAAVPELLFEPRSIIAGDGWALARWVLGGTTSYGLWTGGTGATMFEVRDGKIARQTMYYDTGASPLQ